MFKFFFIWIVDFLFDLIDVNFFLLFLISVVVFDHHNSFPFIVPGSIGILIDDFIFLADKERFRKNTVDHHNETFYSEKTRVVLLLKVKQIMVLFDVLFKFLLHLVDVFFLLEVFIIHLFLQFKVFKFFVNFVLLFDFLYWFLTLAFVELIWNQ